MPIKKGDIVKIAYIGKLEDGSIIDIVDEKNPIEFEVGSGKVLKYIEDAVIGMEKGDEKIIKVLPKDAYGEIDKKLLIEFNRDLFPDDIKVDMIVFLDDNNNKEKPIPGRIKEISKDKVIIDLNYPLAGETLIFSIKIVDVV
ncbi:MAG: FKBP-type peptidyl-prolyl cis-trans isomerase [Candidatus Helarchaeota archaeon]